MDDDSFLGAVFFYYGILEAYELVGQELIGDNVLEEHVIPRMVYYVKNFLPKSYNQIDPENLPDELLKFVGDLKSRVSTQNRDDINLQDIWQLRAAIFGYESAFLELLGDNVIKNYVLQRIPEILAVYLPEVFAAENKTLSEKLEVFAAFLKDNHFTRYANFEIRNNKIRFNVNKCAFASIHDSEAYREKKTRFCPWGMMVLAIVNAHEQREFPISSSTFTTRGTITKLEIFD